MSAFAVWLGAGGSVLGVVGSLPTASAALSQAVSGRVRSGKLGARTFIVTFWTVQAIVVIALGTCVLMPRGQALLALCVLTFLAWSAAGVPIPAWTALVSGTVPRSEHGRFFGLRGASQQAGVLVAILGGGALLSAVNARNADWAGFVLVFGIAGLSRGLGNLLFLAVPRGSDESRPRPPGGLLDALSHSAKFRRLSVYLWSLHFATWVASPFFIPYMIRDLRLPYYQIGLLIAVPAFVKVFTLRYWGRVADTEGPGRLLRRMGWLVVPVSALWLVSGELWWIFLAQVYAGFAWGGLELAQASALLQTSRGREGAVALFNLVDGAVMIAGSMLGGFLVVLVDGFGGRGFLVVMAASCVLRAVPAALLLWRVKGLGFPRWSHARLPLRLWGVRPARGMTFRPWPEFVPPEEKDPRGTDGGTMIRVTRGEHGVLHD